MTEPTDPYTEELPTRTRVVIDLADERRRRAKTMTCEQCGLPVADLVELIDHRCTS